MDYVDEEEGALMVRYRTIIPCLEICAVNCLNWDTYQKCKIFLKGRLCASWRPRDLGDGDAEEEQVPFHPESLGGADVKQAKRSIEPPTDEVDEEVEEVEEVAENA